MQSFSKTIKVYYVAWLSTEEYISIFYISNPTFVMEMAKLRPQNSREFWWTVFYMADERICNRMLLSA